MTRIYSGATKRDIEPTKHDFFPVTSGTDMTNIGGHPAALVNGAGDSAYIEVKSESGDIGSGLYLGIYLVVIPAATAAAMRFTLGTTSGVSGQAYNNKAVAVAQVFNATQNQITEIDITLAFVANSPERREYAGIYVDYLITATATNMHVLGARVVKP